MNDNKFSMVYDGEDIAGGTIDARDLAPALIALADILDESAPVVFGAAPRLSVRIRSGFDQGSFEVHLELASMYQRFVGLFSGPDAQALGSFLQITGIAGAFGLLQLIRKSKGQKPTSVTIERTEKVTITFEGEKPDTIDRRIYSLFKNYRVRKAVEQIIQPLFHEGVDIFKIRRNGKETFSVAREEAPFFIAPTELEGETNSITDTRLAIVSPSFQPYNKWRVSDGSRTIFVSIADEEFMASVQKGSEAFRKGDVLHVSLRTTQWLENGQLKADYAIIKVHRHESAPQQQKLF